MIKRFVGQFAALAVISMSLTAANCSVWSQEHHLSKVPIPNDGPVAPVPEPAAGLLFVVGSLVVAVALRREN